MIFYQKIANGYDELYQNFSLKRVRNRPGVVAHTCHLSTQEAEEQKPRVEGQPGQLEQTVRDKYETQCLS